MIGRVLGNFRILSLLGRGGMGEVWKAEQVTLGGRFAAVKVLAPRVTDPDKAIERLQREGAIAANIRNSGIAGILEAGTTDGIHWIALEYIDGETLGERLKRGPLEPAEACRVIGDVADALAHAHTRGVLHRDITSNNIMLERGGRTVLLDFGLALTEGPTRLTPEGAIVGTPQYLAPEVLRGLKADARSDVYALGVVFYEALTGAPPFKSERAEGAFHGPLHENPEAPSKRRAGLGAAWDALALRALAREPGLRVVSAAEFAAAVRQLASPPAPEGHYDPIASDEITRSRGGRAAVPTPAPARMRRLAVVPFHELSGERDGDAFADGFAEAICGALARYPGLQVVPPTLTRPVVREGTGNVAREFAADHLLSGTVQRAGERLRVTCSLVDAAQGTQVYGDRFEGTREQLFTIEDQLVKALASALRLAPPSPQPDRHTPDPVAHEKLLQARGYLQRFDNEASVDGAIALLEPLAHAGGAPARVWAELARAYRHKYRHVVDRVWLERSLHACEQALAIDPQDVVAITARASTNVQLGRHEEAEAGYREVLRCESDEMNARTGLMELLRKLGRLEESEDECRKGIAIRPTDWSSWNLLGATLFEMGRYEEAIDSWRQVIRLAPDSGRARANIGAAFFRLGELVEAESAYRDAVEHQRSGMAFTGLGTVLFYKRDMLGAEEAFEKAVGLRGRDPLVWGNLAAARRWLPDREHQVTENYDQAILLAQESLATDPNSPIMLSNLALWLACRGEFTEAEGLIERALLLDPRGALTHAHAITVHELAGRRERAMDALKKAIELGHGWAELELDRDLQRLRDSEQYVSFRRLDTRTAPKGEAPLRIGRRLEES